MKFTNSPLVEYTKLSPNKTSPRNHIIDTISIHVMAGDLSIESCGNIFSNPNRKASSNYGIDSKGRIGLYCNESDRTWCTSNAANDHRAITIEVANSVAKHPWPISDAAMSSLIKLCADICKRNNIKKLLWRADKSLIGNIEKQNMTVHRWFANKTCIPIESELLTEEGWKSLKNIQLNEKVANVNPNNLSITFSPVLDIVPIRKETVFNIFGVEVTKDHRMLFCNGDKTFKTDIAANLIGKENISIPLAGYIKTDGLNITDKQLALIGAMLTNGTPMIENNNFIGMKFDISNFSKGRLYSILSDFNLIMENDNKTIEVYDRSLLSFYSSYLEGKNKWKLIYLDRRQAGYLLNILHRHIHLLDDDFKDLLFALATLNGNGVEVGEDFIIDGILKPYCDPINERETDVSCVSVTSGFILIRQNNKSFVVGNCPGDYVYSKLGYIAEEVNKMLGVNEENKTSIPQSITPSDPAEVIWKFLKDKGFNDYTVAGIMGNLFAESGLIPTNLQNNYETRLGFDDLSYTKAVDDDVYKNFAKDKAGYGLAQWTYHTRKAALLEYAKHEKVSIGDLNMQLNFLWKEFVDNNRLLVLLKSANTVRIASDIMLKEFERPADMSEAVQKKRAEYGMKYYNRFATKGVKETSPVVETSKVEEKEEEVADTPKSNIPTVEIPKAPKVEKTKLGDMISNFLATLFKSIFAAIGNIFSKKKVEIPTVSTPPTVSPVSEPLSPKNPVIPPVNVTIEVPVTEKTSIPEKPKVQYQVQVIRNLNYREGPGTNFKVLGTLKEKEIYTIIEEAMNGATKWGKLKSGAGWISLTFTKKL